MNPESNSSPALPPGEASPLVSFFYNVRWLSTALVIAVILGLMGSGANWLGNFSSTVAGLGGDEEAAESAPPLVFDPSMDLWFGEGDSAVKTWYEIEDQFVAEDFIVIAIETRDEEFGAFSRESLATIRRLTEEFLKVPGVRHVRSLTYNPWIRWGSIEDDLGSEEGLIISDLLEVDPQELEDEDIIERMVAVLGAERAAARVGEDRVRAVIGADADFADHIGEPLLLGTILNDEGDTSVIQVQVLRPLVDEEKLVEAFDGDERAMRVAPTLYSVAQQRHSLVGLEHLLRREQGLAVPSEHYEELVAHVDSIEDQDERNAARLELLDPRFNTMVGKDGVEVPKYDEYEEQDGVLVNLATGEPAPPGFTPKALSPYSYRIAGSPLFERNFEVVGMADSKYMSLMFLVIIVMLYMVFRNVTGVIVPLAVVFGSIFAMVLGGFSQGNLMNNLTMMSPNMLTAVGIADAVHLVASWVALRPHYSDRKALIMEVMERNALPVLLTSITTAVGFYSLTVSHLVPVKMLGSSASFGTIMAYALSMTLVPAMLSLVPHHKPEQKVRHSKVAELFSIPRSKKFVAAILAHRGKVLVGALVLVVTSVIGVTRVQIDSDFRAMFPDDNPTMTAFNWIEARMGGVGDLEMVFTGPQELGEAPPPELTPEEEQRLAELQLRELGAQQSPDEFTALSSAELEELEALNQKFADWNARRIGVSTEFLATLGKFEQRLRSEMAVPTSDLAIVTDFISPLDTLRKINQVQHENKASAYRVPREGDVGAELREPELYFDEWSEEWTMIPGQTGSNLVAQYYLQYESGARPGESLTTQLSADRTQFRVQGRIQQATSMDHIKAFNRIQQIAMEEFPSISGRIEEDSESHGSVADMTLSGKTLLFARTSDLFANGFLQSMSIALFAITILIGIVFRSVRLALISLIPNLLPIMVPLSVFGLLGVPLDGPAILVSSVALGVCVDDTIHFFTKYVRGRRKGYSPEDALVQTMHQSGAAMAITTFILVIGFGTLLLSDFSPNFQMGALAGVMIILAWIFDFVVTLAVLSFAGSYNVTVQAPAPAEAAAA